MLYLFYEAMINVADIPVPKSSKSFDSKKGKSSDGTKQEEKENKKTKQRTILYKYN